MINFYLGNIPIRNARNIEYKDNEDGTFQLWFNSYFTVDKNKEPRDCRIHIPKIRINSMPLISMEEVDGKLWEILTER